MLEVEYLIINWFLLSKFACILFVFIYFAALELFYLQALYPFYGTMKMVQTMVENGRVLRFVSSNEAIRKTNTFFQSVIL